MVRQVVPEHVARLTQRTLNAVFALHTEIGPGCFERVYETCLARLLADDGLKVERQKPVPFEYRGERMPIAFRAALMVEDQLLVEIKSVSNLLSVHFSQVRTYLRISAKPVGLLLNFGAEHMCDGYDRITHRDYVFLPPSRMTNPIPKPSGTSGTSGASGAAPQGRCETG